LPTTLVRTGDFYFNDSHANRNARGVAEGVSPWDVPAGIVLELSMSAQTPVGSCSVIILALLLCGCGSANVEVRKESALSIHAPKIELLGFGGCPNTPILRERLKAAVNAVNSRWTFVDIDQESLGPDDLRRGYPTPTILVNGRDLYGLPVPHEPSMGCRIYPGGLPSTQSIAERLKANPGG
jgi:hypothetical protein